MGRARYLFTATALLCLAVSAVSFADAGPEEVEEIEAVEVVEVVQALSTKAVEHERDGFTFATVYGRLHPAIVHLPIGFLVLLLILEISTSLKPSEGAERITLIALAATLISTLPALLSGFLRTSEMWPVMEPPELLSDHRLAMFAMTGAIAVAMAVRLVKRRQLKGAWRAGYLVALVVAVALAGYGGHEGGKLVFGPQHLPF